MKSRRLPLLLWALAGYSVIFIAGCGTTDPNHPLAKYGPVSGGRPTRFVVTGSSFDLVQIVAVAETLRKYRRLELSEQQKLERLGQEKFNGFVVREVEFLKKQKSYRDNVTKIRQRKTQRVQQAQRTAAAKRRAVASRPATTPAQRAEKEAEIAAIAQAQTKEEAEATREETVTFASLNDSVQEQALKNTRSQLSNFALPQQTPDNSNVVAFASVSSSGNVSVNPNLWVINENPRTLIANVSAGQTPAIRHEGTEIALVE